MNTSLSPPADSSALWAERTRPASAPDSPPHSAFDGWMREHSVAVSSLLQLAGQACYAISGGQEKSWARSSSALIHSGSVVMGSLYGMHPQAADEEDVGIGERFVQAFNPKTHIRQTIGLGTMLGGFLSLYSGISLGYRGEVVSGVAGALGGAMLMFEKSNAQAWERMSVLNLAVLTPAGFYLAIESKNKWVIAAEVAQTLSDAVSYGYTSKVAKERADARHLAALGVAA